ncbi:MAG: hypothetical protein KGH79_04865, partial [Patescibacteria group bacterium]|nr:hypothetical protein [Patescibacteria group bacterium]
LYCMLIGGAVAAAYNLLEAGGRNETAAMVDEEGQYLAAKINWTLGAETPANPAVFDVASGTMRLAWGSNAPEVISDNAVRVSDFSLAAAGGMQEASFTLTALTPNGFSYEQTFSTAR